MRGSQEGVWGRARQTDSNPHYSFIHADLHTGNLLVAENRLAVIDFDDSSFGWHSYDAATVLFAAQGSAPRSKQRPRQRRRPRSVWCAAATVELVKKSDAPAKLPRGRIAARQKCVLLGAAAAAADTADALRGIEGSQGLDVQHDLGAFLHGEIPFKGGFVSSSTSGLAIVMPKRNSALTK